jgi:superfamily II DNA or RNA helicase
LATGTGKTFAAFKAILTMPFGSRVLIIYETSIREHNFKAEIYKFQQLYGINLLEKYQIEFECYQLVHRWTDKHYNLVIADEIHDSLTPIYSQFYNNNRYDAILGLSATINRSTPYSNGMTKGDYLMKYCPIVYSYSLKESIDNSTTRDINCYIVYGDLSTVDRTLIPYKKNGKTLYYSNTEKYAYDYWSTLITNAMFGGSYFIAKYLGSRRCGLLWSLKYKERYLDELLQYLNRTVIFGNNISILEKYAPTVSSRLTKPLNLDIIEKFNKGVYNTIASFKVLKQGITLQSLDNIILHSYYGNQKDFIQIMGRMRYLDNAGNVFIFCTRNSKEVQWVEAITKDTGVSLIHCTSIEDCINKLKPPINATQQERAGMAEPSAQKAE